MILSHAPPCSCKSKEKEKEKKRNINNDLAVLPSHDRWKVKEMEFLGVVIGSKGVKIQKEKVKKVLN